jgi:hypothetical protein
MNMGFWIFIGLVVLATTYQEVEERKSKAKLLEAALDKGEALDPELLERLFPGESGMSDGKPKDPRSLRISAVIVASIGVGLGILALAVKQIDINGFWFFLGLGGLTLAISAGIYIASRMRAAHLRSDSTSFQSPT